MFPEPMLFDEKDKIFVHGWGIGPDFWTNWHYQNSHFWDLGYFSKDIYQPQFNKPVIGITHSLGLWKLLESKQPLEMLIIFSGFKAFKHEGLAPMLKNLKKNPKVILNHFWKLAEFEKFSLPQFVDVERLYNDLQILESGVCPELPKCPIYIFHGSKDRIIHEPLVNSKQIDSRGHNLGYQPTDIVEKMQIMDLNFELSSAVNSY